METIKGYFDDIRFDNCILGEHKLDGDRLIIEVLDGLNVTEHHPLARGDRALSAGCRLVFQGFTYCKCVVRKKPPQKDEEIFLGPFSHGHGPTRAFTFQGGKNPPVSRVQWDIEATDFALEVR